MAVGDIISTDLLNDCCFVRTRLCDLGQLDVIIVTLTIHCVIEMTVVCFNVDGLISICYWQQVTLLCNNDAQMRVVDDIKL